MAGSSTSVADGQLRAAQKSPVWALVPLVVVAPLVILLCNTLWHAPFPLSEGVAILEDVQQNPPATFLKPQGSYYRPLFYLTLSSIWHNSATTRSALTSIKLLHIVPVIALVMLCAWQLRPRSALEAAAGTFALTVLLGSPGFLGNLEIPLSYTIVAMPIALIVWMVLESQHRPWHGPLVVALVVVAVGFKEQGLVLIPVVVAAWWAGAPGVKRGTVAALVVIAMAYVALRFYGRENWPPFEQDIGYGFTSLSPGDAEARFGGFRLWIYAYNGASTVGNLLFAEPTNGVFRIVRDITAGNQQSWETIYLLSSVTLTMLIAWWGVGALRAAYRDGWSPESRVALAVVVATLACGALSFDYSRDRLSGMAVVFYALAAFLAARVAARRASRASLPRWLAVSIVLLLLAGAWELRATYTLERSRQLAMSNRREWITALQRRREEFKDRPVYTNILERMVRQGAEPNGIAHTLYPRWFLEMLGE